MSTTITAPWSYEPPSHHRITAQATANVTERHFVSISGNRAVGGNLAVAPSAAGDRPFGVAAYSAPAGQLVLVARGGVVKVIAAGAIAAGAAVQVGTGGAVSTASGTNPVVGVAVNGAADGGIAEIALY
ncbi:capsid cement protein [Mycobacterium senriense]|uniref:DUF2190 domain-containing protein n=1 Tax=Mycobacterium senriense TaxID=2775496 RepID=A0ABM7SU29_9MYCO|nr:capsid cement protein [Mycobacterium senriense]BCZ24853.1 hypothetical protein MTY59_47080 [Mycobacterium senriense]